MSEKIENFIWDQLPREKHLLRKLYSSSLLYECPAETRLTVYRRFSLLTRGEIAWTCNRRNLWHWTSGLKFNWYFAFWLLVLLHWKSFKCIEVLFSVSISWCARPKFDFEPACHFPKKLRFLVDFFEKMTNFKNHQRIENFSKFHLKTYNWRETSLIFFAGSNPEEYIEDQTLETLIYFGRFFKKTEDF